jgi:hypothetical protein
VLVEDRCKKSDPALFVVCPLVTLRELNLKTGNLTES